MLHTTMLQKSYENCEDINTPLGVLQRKYVYDIGLYTRQPTRTGASPPSATRDLQLLHVPRPPNTRLPHALHFKGKSRPITNRSSVIDFRKPLKAGVVSELKKLGQARERDLLSRKHPNLLSDYVRPHNHDGKSASSDDVASSVSSQFPTVNGLPLAPLLTCRVTE
ncbi:hypothetical protein BIW11_04453, partial [Tropilaelaps mercedesae]